MAPMFSVRYSLILKPASATAPLTTSSVRFAMGNSWSPMVNFPGPPKPARTNRPPGLTSDPTLQTAHRKDSWSAIAHSMQLQERTTSKASSCSCGSTPGFRTSQWTTLRIEDRVRSSISSRPFLVSL
uniref:Putative secreted protein n=1 Tax=Ixodes ricinus TaxID=34613 RepID=A0A6B0UQ85_IXORI